MTAYKYAAELAQYAQDAAKTDQPWTLWQQPPGGGIWTDCILPITFGITNMQYRRKPTTVPIGGTDVPAPESSAPTPGTVYYVPSLLDVIPARRMTWTNSMDDIQAWQRGMIRLSQADAVAHANAMIAPTKK